MVTFSALGTRTALLLLGTLALLPGAQAQNLVLNPGFEMGVFGPWVPGGDQFASMVSNETPRTGTFSLRTGEFAGREFTLLQTLTTVPGQNYTLSYWLRNTDVDQSNYFRVFWEGNQVLAQTNTMAFGYTEYSVNVTASTASTELGFRAMNDEGYWYVDDVSVFASSHGGGGLVPEAPAIAMLLPGLLPLGAMALRKRRNQ